MERLTLSVCLIVRNEETLLPRCLASVQGVADEIVVVDTGSTDRTIEIAQAYGAKVFPHPWPHDFAAARNWSLEYATGDWILILDADEGLVPEAIQILPKLMAQGDAVWSLRIRNYLSDGGDADASEHSLIRLFPNRPHLRFVGAIHEQLVSLNPDQPLAFNQCANLMILHDGYRPEVVARQGKQSRNRTLLEQMAAAEPENPYHPYNLAHSYFKGDEPELGLQALRRCLWLAEPESAQAVTAWVELIGAVAEFESVAAAGRLMLHAPDGCTEFPDFWLTAGAILLNQGEWDQAVAAYEWAASFSYQPPSSDVSWFNRSAFTWKPLVGLADCWLQQARPDTAYVYLQGALESCPENPLVQARLTELEACWPWLAA